MRRWERLCLAACVRQPTPCRVCFLILGFYSFFFFLGGVGVGVYFFTLHTILSTSARPSAEFLSVVRSSTAMSRRELENNKDFAA